MATATELPYVAITTLPNFDLVNQAFESAIPPEPKLAALPSPGIVAAAKEPVQALSPPPDGAIPWYVPFDRHADYLTCLERPDRFAVLEWISKYDWPIAEALYVQGNEGADLCQFNYQGSGACGWFQLLRCPPDGLTPEGQLRAAYAKWSDTMCGDGGRSFYCHWFRFWVKPAAPP